MAKHSAMRHPLPAALLAPLFTILAACETAAPPPAPATPPSTSTAAPQAAARTTRIWISAEGGTMAAPPQDPKAPPPGPETQPSRYRIEPGSSGYEVVEVVGAADARRAPVADGEVAKLVTLARSLAPKMCPGHHSAHNDPEIHFEGEVKIDALGGLGLACDRSDKACAACGESFTTLHAAVLEVAKGALK